MAKGVSSIPGQGTKILQVWWYSQNTYSMVVNESYPVLGLILVICIFLKNHLGLKSCHHSWRIKKILLIFPLICGCIFLNHMYFSFLSPPPFLELFLAELCFCYCTQAFSSCRVWTSHCSGFLLLLRSMGSRLMGFSSCSTWAQQLFMDFKALARVVASQGLRCPEAHGIFPDQGLNQCPLHCKGDSYTLDHREKPSFDLIKLFKCFLNCLFKVPVLILLAALHQ